MATSSQSCVSCHKPLVLQIEPHSDDDEEEPMAEDDPLEMDDDLRGKCGCHFHWSVSR